MTRPDDYSTEMPAPHLMDDATAEALLAGRPDVADSTQEPVVAVVRALRTTAHRPVRPNATLAAQMATGVFTAPAEQYREPARGPQGRGLGAAAGLARTSARALVAAPRLFAGLLTRTSPAAKLAAATLAAVLVGAGSAGFAGVLPEPVQGGFESVVKSVSGYEFPARPGGGADFGREVRKDATDDESPAVRGPETSERAPTERPGTLPPTEAGRPTDRPGQPGPSGPPGPPGQSERPGPPDGVPGPPPDPGPPDGPPQR